MQRWLANALSIMMADITVDALENLDSLEVIISSPSNNSFRIPITNRYQSFWGVIILEIAIFYLHRITSYSFKWRCIPDRVVICCFPFYWQIYPSQIPDLSSGSPLIVSGRFSGKFPELARVSGVLVDRSICTIDLKVQHVKDVPIDRVIFDLESKLLDKWSSYKFSSLLWIF